MTVATDAVGSVGLYVPRQPVVSEGIVKRVLIPTEESVKTPPAVSSRRPLIGEATQQPPSLFVICL